MPGAAVVAVHRSGIHAFSKAPEEAIELLPGLGVAGDAVEAEAKHCGGEMVIKGEEIQRIGAAIPADGPQRSGNR